MPDADSLPTFAELVEQVRRGDVDAARSIVERYQRAIRREVRFSISENHLRRVFDETDVLPAVIARVFIDLWAGRYDCDGPRGLLERLKMVTQVKVAERARSWTPRRPKPEREDEGQLNLPSEPGTPEPSPSQPVFNAAFLAEFERRLSDDEWSILTLRRQGASWTEVALRLDDAPEAVRRKLERAIDRVGRELGIGV
jgi:hypothetical protein